MLQTVIRQCETEVSPVEQESTTLGGVTQLLILESGLIGQTQPYTLPSSYLSQILNYIPLFRIISYLHLESEVSGDHLHHVLLAVPVHDQEAILGSSLPLIYK